MSTPKPFADIRIIKGRQVLAYTESTHDGFEMPVIFRLGNGTNVTAKMIFDTQRELSVGFKDFREGGLDGTIEKMIMEMDKNIKVTRCRSKKGGEPKRATHMVTGELPVEKVEAKIVSRKEA